MEDLLAADASDDASCSICLESFTEQNPATVTVCNHEYHLQCIIEWSQRSRECPICWRSLALSDPISQELLAGAGVVRTARRPVSHTRRFIPFEQFELLNARSEASEDAEGIDINERIRQHIQAAAMSRDCSLASRRGSACALLDYSQQLLPATPSHSRHSFRRMDGQYSGGPLVEGNMSPLLNHSSPEELPLSLTNSPHVSESSFVHNRRGYSDQSAHASPVHPSSPRNPRLSQSLSFSGSLKSKLSAASSRYKESFSRGTRSLKEKLSVHNNSFKELGKEVKREVTAGIAGVGRMMERLDLPSRRSGGVSPLPNRSQGTSELPCNGDSQKGYLAAHSCEVSDARKMPVSSSAPTQVHDSHP